MNVETDMRPRMVWIGFIASLGMREFAREVVSCSLVFESRGRTGETSKHEGMEKHWKLGTQAQLTEHASLHTVSFAN